MSISTAVGITELQISRLSGLQDVAFVAPTNGQLVTFNGIEWGNASAATPAATLITIGNEAADTTCFPIFTTAATGNLGPKTNTGFTFDSSTQVINVSGGVTTGALTVNIMSGNVLSGVYTPTRSAEANLDANVTMTEAQYLRVGNTVTVGGRFTADPTLTATTTSFEITLPIASNIGAAEDVSGTAFCGNIVSMGGEVIGVVANDTAKIQWKSSDVTSQIWSYIFIYQVI